ncbi:MAG: hypothetical protein ACJAZN_001359 [Planctomycetota bacterium]|jgi:hypothetical protein
MIHPRTTAMAALLGAATSFAFLSPALAQIPDRGPATSGNSVYELDGGEIVAADASGTYVYDTWDAYLRSSFFLRNGKRCGFSALAHPPEVAFLGSQSDCTNSSSFPDPVYDPNGSSAPVYDIPIAFHVLYSNNGAGNIPDARIYEQIDILNQDFAALTNSRIQFHLATEDPQGGATTGITRTRSTSYYNDRGSYATAVGWDTTRYLNIYSNTAGGNLGYAYVPNGGGVVGSSFDGVRLLWNSIGLTNYVPYNLGRTGTHEVGHYLGLFHTFDGGCGTSNCNASGDFCCDTNPESSPSYTACSPSERSTCGSQDPVRNYMDYSEDACMDEFTMEQAFRMRCTLENWRVDLTTWEGGGTGGTAPDQVSGASPSSGASNVPVSAVLGWASASGASQYDVFFGTSSNPPSASLNQASTSYDPGTLAASTTYFWRVDSENGTGTTAGNEWSFTTAAETGGGAIFFDDFESGSLGGWTTSGDVRVGSPASTGSFAAQLRRTSSMSRTINVGSATSVAVSWDWSSSNLDSGERVQATITGGSSGPVTVSMSGSSFTPESQTITGVSGSISIEFSTNANRNNERGYIDNVLVQ